MEDVLDQLCQELDRRDAEVERLRMEINRLHAESRRTRVQRPQCPRFDEGLRAELQRLRDTMAEALQQGIAIPDNVNFPRIGHAQWDELQRLRAVHSWLVFRGVNVTALERWR